jgi:hypothetical protein
MRNVRVLVSYRQLANSKFKYFIEYMFAAFARLLTSFSITKFELLLHSQGTNADFCTWALKLKESLLNRPNFYQDMERIIERGINEDNFLLPEIRMNAILSCILNYTSSTEYFLVDLILWKLKDKRLFKRALDLKETVVRKFDIVEIDSIEDLRNKYILQLSGQFSEGELWAKKMSNASKLFDVPFDKNSQITKSIDSIWEQRNKFAHLNRIHYLPISIIDLNGEITQIQDLKDNESYFHFCLQLLELMSEGIQEIDKFQERIIQKW